MDFYIDEQFFQRTNQNKITVFTIVRFLRETVGGPTESLEGHSDVNSSVSPTADAKNGALESSRNWQLAVHCVQVKMSNLS